VNREDLAAVLQKHAAWLQSEEGGERANLRGADLRWANLREVDLGGADLREADLRRADLREVDLGGADLREANLHGADLRWANLRDADLREADLDFASWPLWCGTKNVRVDVRIFRQLAMHLCGVVVDDDECRAAQEALMPLARQCHRADAFLGEVGK